MSISKELIKISRKERKSLEKDFKNRALMVIQAMCMGDIIYGSVEKLQEDIYVVAHCALGSCSTHEDWIKNTEETFKEFKELGLL